MKKFAIIATFAVAFAFSASMAFANECGQCGGWWWDRDECCPETKVINKNIGIGVNSVETKSYSGMNNISGTYKTNANIQTGNVSAYTDAINDINNNKVSVDAPSRGEVLVVNENAGAGLNFVKTKSYSGMNNVSGTCKTTATIRTGTASSYTGALNMVNTNVINVK